MTLALADQTENARITSKDTSRHEAREVAGLTVPLCEKNNADDQVILDVEGKTP